MPGTRCPTTTVGDVIVRMIHPSKLRQVVLKGKGPYAFRQTGVPNKLSLLAEMAIYETNDGSEGEWETTRKQLERFKDYAKKHQELLVAEGLLTFDEIDDDAGDTEEGEKIIKS